MQTEVLIFDTPAFGKERGTGCWEGQGHACGGESCHRCHMTRAKYQIENWTLPAFSGRHKPIFTMSLSRRQIVSFPFFFDHFCFKKMAHRESLRDWMWAQKDRNIEKGTKNRKWRQSEKKMQEPKIDKSRPGGNVGEDTDESTVTDRQTDTHVWIESVCVYFLSPDPRPPALLRCTLQRGRKTRIERPVSSSHSLPLSFFPFSPALQSPSCQSFLSLFSSLVATSLKKQTKESELKWKIRLHCLHCPVCVCVQTCFECTNDIEFCLSLHPIHNDCRAIYYVCLPSY